MAVTAPPTPAPAAEPTEEEEDAEAPTPSSTTSATSTKTTPEKAGLRNQVVAWASTVAARDGQISELHRRERGLRADLIAAEEARLEAVGAVDVLAEEAGERAAEKEAESDDLRGAIARLRLDEARTADVLEGARRREVRRIRDGAARRLQAFALRAAAHRARDAVNDARWQMLEAKRAAAAATADANAVTLRETRHRSYKCRGK